MSNPPNIDDVRFRRGQIAAERASLKTRDQQLAFEDQELEVAERALARLAGHSPPESHPYLPLQPQATENPLGSWLTAEGWKKPNRDAPINGTVEELIVWLLEGSVDIWANANQIRAGLSGTLRRDVPMSTVSPTLTMMKNKGTIVRDNLKVALAVRFYADNANRAAADSSAHRPMN